MSRAERVLSELGLTLPPPPQPAADYLPWTVTGDLVHIAGQTPRIGRALQFTGQIGGTLTLDQGRQAAQICALRLLSALQAAVGDLDGVLRIAKLTVYVNGAPGFTDHSAVADGASQLLSRALGDCGRHARSAVGVAGLPGNAPVEIDMVAQIVT
ncbi:RidA family protein [Ponticoccus sp. (in: a-proteobacteria)]|uniref:RidA family protein n=1 Tax=Ponticoccus sp. (in: a-proteobacteria) TaxID=1925025 RepID=UPI003AB1C535